MDVPPRRPVDLVLSSGWVLTMDSARTTHNPGAVAIDGSDIVAVGSSADIERSYAPRRSIDLAGHVVMPGLVNTHGHASTSLIRGMSGDRPLEPWLREVCWPMMNHAQADDLYAGNRLSMLELILGGVTTTADMWTGVDSAAAAADEVGIRALLAHNIKDFGDAARGSRELDAALAAHEAHDGRAGGRIRVGLAPHSVYACEPDLLARCAEVAGGRGLPLQIHVAETAREVAECRAQYGRSPVELLHALDVLGPRTVAAHLVHTSDDDLEVLAATGTGVSYNPVSNAKLASGVAPVLSYIDAGLRVGLGTDGPGTNDGLDVLSDLKIAVLAQRVASGDASTFRADQALHLATQGGADVLGLGDHVGSLEPAKRADLLALDFTAPHLAPWDDDDPAQTMELLVYCAHACDVALVVVDGDVVVEQAKACRVDEDEVRSIARERATRIARRVRAA